MSSAVRLAHLFLCLENGHYGVSNDGEGANLPTNQCLSGWKFVMTFNLGAQDALPFGANPEPIIRALADDGYWVMTNSAFPHGTSQ